MEDKYFTMHPTVQVLTKGWITDTFWDFVGDAFWQGVFLPKDYKGSWKKGLFYTFYTGKCDTILHTGLTSPPSPSLHSVNFSWAIVVVVFSYVRITNFYYFCKFSLMSQNKISIISVIRSDGIIRYILFESHLDIPFRSYRADSESIRVAIQ